MCDKYINDRLNEQIKWYDTKSIKCQKRHKILKITSIISASLIPFLVPYSNNYICLQIFIGLLAVLISITESSQSFLKYHEKWIKYRTTCETLRHHKMLYENNCGEYDSEDKYSRLVENCESIISKENTEWMINSFKGEKKK